MALPVIEADRVGLESILFRDRQHGRRIQAAAQQHDGLPRISHQSTRAPEAFTTGAHFAISLFTNAPNCSCVIGMKRAPSLGRRAWISGDCMIFSVSAFQRRTISCGVPAGAKKPTQLVTAKPGSAASATVGRSG